MARTASSSRRCLVALNAAVLIILLLPAAAPQEHVALGAVQQPFQCRPVRTWWEYFDILGLDSDDIQDDIAPRNTFEVVTGPQRLGISVPATSGVMQNDDLGTVPYRARLVTPPAHAADFALDEDGSFRWTPVAGYLGGDSFVYSYHRDAYCEPFTGTVTIPPVDGRLVDDTFTGVRGAPYSPPSLCLRERCGVLLNDLADAGPITSAEYDSGFGRKDILIDQPTTILRWNLPIFTLEPIGTLLLRHDGFFTYTPFTPVDSFHFVYRTGELSTSTRSDWSPSERTAHTTINFSPLPPPSGFFTPVAVGDAFETDEDTPITITKADLIANDASVTVVRRIFPPPVGTTQVNTCSGLGCVFGEVLSLTYTPPQDFDGVVGFAYEGGNTSPNAVGTPVADFSVLVHPVADDPQLVDDTFDADRAVPTVLSVLENDVDVDGRIDPSTLALEFQPDGGAAGSLALPGDGTFVYTPDGSVGQKTFSYVVKDVDGAPFQASFTVNINPNPAANDAYTMDEDTVLTVPAPGVLANDTASGTLITSTSGLSLNQDGSFTYQPPPNFSGTSLLTYFNDGDSASITVTVNPKADGPGLLLNVASCPAICPTNPDPDDRDGIAGGDIARLRGLVADVDRDPGRIEIDWGDGETTTQIYPCGFADLLCPMTRTQTWFVSLFGACGLGSCDDTLFFDLNHQYLSPPMGGGLRYTITVTATSRDGLTATTTGHATLADSDADLVGDGFDNCAEQENPDQADNDGDGAGDLCDEDDDNDAVGDFFDNCIFAANADQADNDRDFMGDACDPDDDNDIVVDTADNCPLASNAGQEDLDGDGQGDACDPDDDGDGVGDTSDNCPALANPGQANNDGDASGDACDPDDDNDAVGDGTDNCQFVANAGQANFDGDALGDACDPNDDNDALPDAADACDFQVPVRLDVDADGCTDTITGLKVIVTNLPVDKKLKSPLLSKLGDAEKAWRAGKIPQAEARLAEFVAQVERLRGKGLTTAQADLLISYANNVIAIL